MNKHYYGNDQYNTDSNPRTCAKGEYSFRKEHISTSDVFSTCLDVEVLLCVRIDIRMWKYTLAKKWYLKNIPSKVSLNSHSIQNFPS